MSDDAEKIDPEGLAEAERLAGALGRAIGNNLPREVGFVLVLFNRAPGGWMTYMANGERAGVRRMLRELLAKLDAEAPPAS